MIIRWHVNYKNYKDDIILDFLANILFYQCFSLSVEWVSDLLQLHNGRVLLTDNVASVVGTRTPKVKKRGFTHTHRNSQSHLQCQINTRTFIQSHSAVSSCISTRFVSMSTMSFCIRNIPYPCIPCDFNRQFNETDWLTNVIVNASFSSSAVSPFLLLLSLLSST